MHPSLPTRAHEERADAQSPLSAHASKGFSLPARLGSFYLPRSAVRCGAVFCAILALLASSQQPQNGLVASTFAAAANAEPVADSIDNVLHDAEPEEDGAEGANRGTENMTEVVFESSFFPSRSRVRLSRRRDKYAVAKRALAPAALLLLAGLGALKYYKYTSSGQTVEGLAGEQVEESDFGSVSARQEQLTSQPDEAVTPDSSDVSRERIKTLRKAAAASAATLLIVYLAYRYSRSTFGASDVAELLGKVIQPSEEQAQDASAAHDVFPEKPSDSGQAAEGQDAPLPGGSAFDDAESSSNFLSAYMPGVLSSPKQLLTGAAVLAAGGILGGVVKKGTHADEREVERLLQRLKDKSGRADMRMSAVDAGSKAAVVLADEVSQLSDNMTQFESDLALSIAAYQTALQDSDKQYQVMAQELEVVRAELVEKKKLLKELMGKSPGEAAELLQNRLDAAQKAATEEKQRAEQLVADMKVKEKAVADQKAAIKKLQAKLDDTLRRALPVDDQVKEIESKLQEARERVHRREEEATRLARELAEAEDAKESLARTVKELQRNLNEHLSDEEKVFVEGDNDLDKLKKRLAVEKNLRAQAEAELRTAEETKMSLKGTVESLQRELEMADVGGKVRQLREQLATEKKKHQGASERAESLEKALAETEKSLFEAQSELEQTARDADIAQRELEQMERAAQSLREELRNAQESRRNLTRRAEEAEAEATLATNYLTASERVLTHIKKSLDLIETGDSAVKYLQDTVQRLEQQRIALEQELKEYKKKLQEAEIENGGLRVTLSEMEEQLKEAREELDRRPAKLVAAQEKQGQLERELFLAREGVLRMRDIVRERVDALRAQAKLQTTKKRKREKKLFSLKTAIATSKKEVKRLKHLLEELREKKLKLSEEALSVTDQEELRALRSEEDEVKHTVSKARWELATLERKVNDMEAEYLTHISDGEGYRVFADLLLELADKLELALEEDK
ncbi:hypothetical protein NCLIV_018630 [Neospora caninum Liverpool]|uniref:Uncharacterized protein n=1 Tax=Neospora caninum (strain Liverpool) TaxID=572307 RepID=F0VEC9_NEOCL|nr:hypothetical protein NCLIV_018630 [Neospora caninum Liverpool]CBZ52073.1 hypothetical protein NCLIV_018630 [Neospora caninum Liverpool]CEL66034.1 TPA: hypothetical protein BN1204_018630 [Neospora caninum Liverpool]|eukprot:XP_003882105.1 hypothetical protein NCLIV_018630 [Neospora caninum Liverpool]